MKSNCFLSHHYIGFSIKSTETQKELHFNMWSYRRNITLFFVLQVMLFNLKDDPTETTNLADSMPDKVAELTARLDYWKSLEVEPDFASEGEIPEGAAANFGGIWTPGWCDKSSE